MLNPAWLASWYGATASANTTYETAQRYVEYLLTQRDAATGLLTYGLGDWLAVVPSPACTTPTGLLVQDLQALAVAAARLGRTQDAANYSALATTTAAAYHAVLWNGTAYPTQAAAGMALTLNITPPAAVVAAQRALVADVLQRGNVTTGGDIGNRYVLDALARAAGGPDVLWASLLRPSSPGYGYLVAQNETALPESWNDKPAASHIHAMLGHVDEFLYRHVAGLRQHEDDTGWQHVVVAPVLIRGLNWVRCAFAAPSGLMIVHWTATTASARSNETGVEHRTVFVLRLTLPLGVVAEVKLPAGDRQRVRIIGSGREVVLETTGTGLLGLDQTQPA